MQLLNNSTTVKMSRTSFELLMNFIQRNQIWSMLAICNEYLSFDVQAKVQASLRPLEALLLSDSGDEGLRVNRGEVKAGLLRGCLEDDLVEEAVRDMQQARYNSTHVASLAKRLTAPDAGLVSHVHTTMWLAVTAPSTAPGTRIALL